MHLNVEHYLGVYTLRKRMQEEGVTTPSEEFKKITQDFVEKLKHLPVEEEIFLRESSFYDSKGNLIMKMPSD